MRTKYLLFLVTFLGIGIVAADDFNVVNTNSVNSTVNVSVGTGANTVIINGSMGRINASMNTFLNPHLFNFTDFVCGVDGIYCVDIDGDVQIQRDFQVLGESTFADNVVMSQKLEVSQNITSNDKICDTTACIGTAVGDQTQIDYIYIDCQECAKSRLIEINYSKGTTLASPFYYKVAIPSSSTGSVNFLITVNRAFLDSKANRVGTDYIYKDYVTMGQNSIVNINSSSKIYYNNLIEMAFPNPAPFADTKGKLFVYDSFMQFKQPYTFSATSSGSSEIYGTYYDYSTKASNIIPNSRTFTSIAHYAEDFENCQAYDNCYAFYANKSRSLFDGLTNITDTTLLDVPHIEVYNVTGSSGYNLSIIAVDTWVNFTGLIQGDIKDFTLSADGIVPSYNGKYKVDYSVSFSGGGSSVYSIGLLINGVEHSPCRIYRKLGATGDVGSASGTCIVSLVAGDKVTGAVQDNTAPAQNMYVWSMNANLIRIGNLGGGS